MFLQPSLIYLHTEMFLFAFTNQLIFSIHDCFLAFINLLGKKYTLRRLEPFDCHKVAFATLNHAAVYFPSHNNTIYPLKQLFGL